MIEQRIGETDDKWTVSEADQRTADHASPMLCRLYEGVNSLENLTAQDLNERSYFGHPTRAQMWSFHRTGFRMKDKVTERMVWDRVASLSVEAKAH